MRFAVKLRLTNYHVHLHLITGYFGYCELPYIRYLTEKRITDQFQTNDCKILIGEIDGSIISIVKID